MVIEIPPVEIVAINSLSMDRDNPNRMTDRQRKALAENMKRYGFIVPIIANKEGLIADGQQRWEVAQSLGMEQVPVIKLPIKDVDRRILRQVLNKLRGEHLLDLDAKEYLRIIEENERETFQKLSTVSEREMLRAVYSLQDPKPEEDNIDYIETTDIEKGDLFQLGEHRLMCGDATNIEDVGRLLGEDKGDILFADPPYGIDIVNDSSVGIGAKVGFKTPTGTVGVKGLVDEGHYNPIKNDDNPFEPQLLLNYAKTVLIFGGNHFASKLPNNSHWLVWDKKLASGAYDNNFSDAELIWTNIKGKTCKIYRYLWSGLLRAGSRDLELKKRVHPTQKPVGLLKMILEDYSKENDIILDPYGGSGSTLIACEDLKRKCRMMEIEPVYCQTILNRWEKRTGKKAVKLN